MINELDELNEPEDELSEANLIGNKYSDSELAQIIERELDAAQGSDSSDIASLRVRNLQFYKSEAIGELSPPGIDDRSSIVSSDVADTVEWMLPGLIRPFVANKKSIKCKAISAQYDALADVAAKYLRYKFFDEMEGFRILETFVKDALIQIVGFVKVYAEEVFTDEEVTYTGLTIAQAQQVAQSGEVIAQTVQQLQIDGQLVESFDLTISKKEKKFKCRVDPVPPEEMRVSSRAKYTEEVPFIAHVYRKTKQELEQDGFDLTDVSSGDVWSQEETERHDQSSTLLRDFGDGELELYQVSESYIKLDDDNDGVAEWLRVLMIGSTIKERAKVSNHPFVYWCPNPMPHVFFGMCPADFAIEPQRLKTSLIRSLVDNVYLTVNKRIGVVGDGANLDDLLNSRPGGIVRLNRPDALIPMEQGTVDGGAWQMVEWAEQWKENRTGFTRYSKGLQADTLNQTAFGVGSMLERGEQRIELQLRGLAVAVSAMFQKILECLGTYQNIEEAVQIDGRWVQINPCDWHKKLKVSIEAGMGTGSEDKLVQAYSQLLQIQQQFITAGVMPPDVAVMAARAMAEAAGLEDVDRLLPPPPPPDPNKKSAEQQKMEMSMQVEQAKQQIDMQKFQAQMQLEQQAKQMDHQRELERISAEIASNERIEVAKIAADREKTLVNLAAGIMAAKGGHAQTTNLIGGTQLDQNAQSPAFSLAGVNDVVSQIQQLAQNIQDPNAIIPVNVVEQLAKPFNK